MRRILLVLSAALIALISAHGLPQGPQGQQPPAGERKKIEFTASVMRSVPGMPDSVMRLIGNVVMHHNGAVVTCDSAYRFGDKRIECYGRVLINKDSTFIYGDKAIYDGFANTAQVFSPLIKVIDGDAVLYTFNFSFNTLDNIGKYWGRGTITQKENRLESVRGYYYADTREFVSVEDVEATDPEYKLMTDSVRYDMNAETADFHTYTVVWNANGEILSATRGTYDNANARYDFTRDTYILTPTREVMCDSLDYDSRPGNAIMRNNIQIRDDEQKVMAFGDYGRYWGEREDAMMTRNPSMLSFDPEQDTMYMRSDTMLLRSIAYELDFRQYDSLRRAGYTDIQIMTANAKAAGDSTFLLSPHGVYPDGLPQSEREGVWSETESHGMREALREMVVAQKSALFMQGGAFTRESLTSEMVDSLLNTGYSSEDIEGQLLYNERKRELEAQGLPVTDSVVYEILESIGAFGNLLPPSEQEVMLDSLKKLETETGGKLLEELGRVKTDGELVGETDNTQTDSELVGETDNTQTDSELVGETDLIQTDGKQAGETDNTQTDGKLVGEPERAAADADKQPNRRERRRLEREQKRETAVKQAAETSSGSEDAAQKSDNLSAISTSLRSILESAGINMDDLLREIREKGMSALPDNLAEQLQALGVDPSMLVPQGFILPVDSLPQSSSVNGDILAAPTSITDPATISERDSLAAAEPVKNDSLQRVIFAYNNVRIFRNDMQAVCDSMVVLSKDSTAHLYIDPIMWNKQNQITSQIIDIYTKNQQIDRAYFNGWPLMVSEVDSTQYNQIKGREMESFFRNDEVYRHVVTGNAQTLYYMVDDDSKKANTFLTVNSSSITFIIEDQEIRRITWFKENDAIGYPINKIPLNVNRFLEGFRWEIKRKPGLKDVFNRIIRPSTRGYYESLPQPMFPITGFIEQERKRLTESGLWEDRVDTLPPHAIEFLRTIGIAK